MKHHIISLCVAAVMTISQGHAGVTLTVPDVNITAGGTSNVVIYFDLGTKAYTAYQFDIAYPEGISSVSDANGNPTFTKGEVYSAEHAVSSFYYTSKGLDRFQCFSVNSLPFTAQSGTLLILPIKAQKTLAVGTYQATISPIEFVQTDATPDRPDGITFNINVTNSVLLDETSTIAPGAASGVPVKVKRTISANEWSTICLPFSMTDAQVKAAFGSDALLADFDGIESTYSSGSVTGIKVKFNSVSAIEANHPYIICVSQAISEFSVENVNIIPEDKPSVDKYEITLKGVKYYNSFIGTYVADTPLPEYTLFLTDNKFMYSIGKTKMKGYRAYFDFYDVLSEVENANVRIFVDVDGVETGIEGIFNKPQDDIYDLSGRKIAKPTQRGVYIVDGKKKLF